MTSRIDRLTYAIGDIHGYDALFERLIERIRADAELIGEKPRLVLLGDYVDRGPDSRGVLERVRRLQSAGWCDLVALMGNHEDAMLRFMQEPEFGPTWREWGGAATAMSYGVQMPFMATGDNIWAGVSSAFAAAVDAEHITMLRAMPASFAAGDYLFVHAGVDPDRPLSEQGPETFMYIRGRFQRAEKACDKVVVHGHTPEREPANLAWRVGVDTGVYYSGVLTAVRLRGEERAMLQVKAESFQPSSRQPPSF